MPSRGAIVFLFLTLAVLCLRSSHAQVATLRTSVAVTLGTTESPRGIAVSDNFVFAMTYHTGTTTTKIYTFDRTGASVVAGPLTVSTSGTDEGSRLTTARGGTVVCASFEGTTIRCYTVNALTGALTESSTGAIGSGTAQSLTGYTRPIACAGGSTCEYIYVGSTVYYTLVYFSIDSNGILGVSPTVLTISGSTGCSDATTGFVAAGESFVTLTASSDFTTLVLSVWYLGGDSTWLISLVLDSSGGVQSCVQRRDTDGSGVTPADLYHFVSVSLPYIFVSSSYDYDLGLPYIARFSSGLILQQHAYTGVDPYIVATSADDLHVYATSTDGIIQQYAYPDIASPFHSAGFGEIGSFTAPEYGYVLSSFSVNRAGDYAHFLCKQSSQAKLITIVRDAVTMTPTLVAPATGDVVGGVDGPGLNVSYVLPEAAGTNTVELRFQPHPSGSPFTIGLVGTTSATFTLPFTSAAQDAHANVRGTGTTIVNGYYNVTVRYNDSLGNVQASSAVQVVCLNNEAVCVGCLPGSFHEDPETCVPCVAGKYSDDVGMTACLDCDPGHGSDEGATECTECEAGQASGGGEACTACSAGTFAADAGASTCDPCESGTFSGESATECEPCEAGHVSGDEASECEPCLAGTYADTDTWLCAECEDGTISGEAATECEPCASGEVSNEGRTACETVAIEGGGGTLLAAEEVGSPLIIVAAVAGVGAGGIVGAAIWAAYAVAV